MGPACLTNLRSGCTLASSDLGLPKPFTRCRRSTALVENRASLTTTLLQLCLASLTARSQNQKQLQSQNQNQSRKLRLQLRLRLKSQHQHQHQHQLSLQWHHLHHHLHHQASGNLSLRSLPEWASPTKLSSPRCLRSTTVPSSS